MNLQKGWEQGRDENAQEDYPTTEIWWKRKDTKTTLHLLLVQFPTSKDFLPKNFTPCFCFFFGGFALLSLIVITLVSFAPHFVVTQGS